MVRVGIKDAKLISEQDCAGTVAAVILPADEHIVLGVLKKGTLGAVGTRPDLRAGDVRVGKQVRPAVVAPHCQRHIPFPVDLEYIHHFGHTHAARAVNDSRLLPMQQILRFCQTDNRAGGLIDSLRRCDKIPEIPFSARVGEHEKVTAVDAVCPDRACTFPGVGWIEADEPTGVGCQDGVGAVFRPVLHIVRPCHTDALTAPLAHGIEHIASAVLHNRTARVAEVDIVRVIGIADAQNLAPLAPMNEVGAFRQTVAALVLKIRIVGVSVNQPLEVNQIHPAVLLHSPAVPHCVIFGRIFHVSHFYRLVPFPYGIRFPHRAVRCGHPGGIFSASDQSAEHCGAQKRGKQSFFSY